MTNEADDWLPTRRSLLTRLRHADEQRGWQEFFETYWRLLYGVARQAGLNEAEAQDAVQDCVITVCRQMPKFRYEPERCSFKGWLLMILRQRIGRQVQNRILPGVASEAAGSESTHGGDGSDESGGIADACSDPLAAIWEEEWQQHMITLATERVKRQVSDAQFQIFDLHVLRGWPVADVARTLGLSVGQIYLAKFRVGRRFRKEVEMAVSGSLAPPA